MTSTARIGLLISDAGSWLGGIYYVENLVKAIASLPAATQPQLYLVAPEPQWPFLEKFEAIRPLISGAICISEHALNLPDEQFGFVGILCRSLADVFHRVDFLFPCLRPLAPSESHFPHAAWIPDFQHRDLPQFFSPTELQARDARFYQMSVLAPITVLSSQHAAETFKQLYPFAKSTPRVLPFHTYPEANWYDGDPAQVAQAYQLPDRFLICVNQFWQHKGHQTVFEAIAHLQRQGTFVHLVCTGDTSDYRNQSYFGELQQQIQALGIADYVHILGTVPRHDQLQLIRRSLAVVQPSLYEGWSTIVEEAKALGKSIILSDFPVHIEQAPPLAHYFACGDTADLARVIEESLAQLQIGPIGEIEQQARKDALQRSQEFATAFWAIAETVISGAAISMQDYEAMSPLLQQLLTESLSLESIQAPTPGADLAHHSLSDADGNQRQELAQLRSLLHETQKRLIASEQHNSQLPQLWQQLEAATQEAQYAKREADERLQLVQSLTQVGNERLALIEQLSQAASDRLDLIHQLNQSAEQQQQHTDMLQQQVNQLSRDNKTLQKQVNQLQGKTKRLQKKMLSSKQRMQKANQTALQLQQQVDTIASVGGAVRNVLAVLKRKLGLNRSA